MLIGEILNTTENVNYILAEFKQHLPGSVDEFEGNVVTKLGELIHDHVNDSLPFVQGGGDSTHVLKEDERWIKHADSVDDRLV